MTERLQTIMDMIPPGRGVIDVGTDHGYVPAALALTEYSGKIIASDLNFAPLCAAKSHAKEMGVEDRINFRLADGLENCNFQEVDTVVIAGMGGDLICSILDRCSAVRRGDVVLVLQPMTKSEILRYFLIHNGWRISAERSVQENGKLFHVLKAVYQGLMIHRENYKDPALEDWELYTGKYELLRKSGSLERNVREARKILMKRLLGKDRFFYQAILDGINAAEIYDNSGENDDESNRSF